jgi:molybdopterin/thiamine biosynthesis adenylyltransferase
MNEDLRTHRFKGLFAEQIDHFIATPHIVIGVGSIGGKVVQMLSQIGVKKIWLIDHDSIEDVNVGPQGFSPYDIGRFKVVAISEQIEYLAGDYPIDICLQPVRFEKAEKLPSNAYWWSMVDSLSTREDILESAIKHNYYRLMDCRMSGFAYEIYCLDTNRDFSDQDTIGYHSMQDRVEQYLAHIEWAKKHPASDGCSSKTTPHVPMIAAGNAINLGLQAYPPYKVIGDLLTYQAKATF